MKQSQLEQNQAPLIAKNWVMTTDANHIVWLGIDNPNAGVNTINLAVLDELDHLLHDIASQSKAIGIIIYSKKSKGFIAGADISVLAQFKTPEAVVEFLKKGHDVFAYLATLTLPTVAMIDGFCMGGGLELALACDYRVASDQSLLGLPEIKLGIHPGWAGTTRLPQLIGGFDALSKVILPGSPLSARKAKQLGVIDDAVALRQLKRAAVYFIQHKPNKHRPQWIQSLTNNRLVQKILAPVLEHQLAKRVNKDHYPAPFAVVDLWKNEGSVGERANLKEIDSIRHLISQNDTSANLIRAFKLRERMKSFAKASSFKAKHVHVIGAGVMGGDIAAWCALRGLHVSLQDKTYEHIAPAMGRAYALFKKKLYQPHLIQAAMDRLLPDPLGTGIAQADVIIEAVFENLDVKQAIFKAVELKAKKTAILATNTSSILLEDINQAMVEPERLVGIHYFNPVAKMELVEVVKSTQTRLQVIDDACAFVNQIGRLPLPVKSSPGFLVNRVLMPYLMECVCLIEEGYSPEAIDAAACEFGMFMGPVALADTVGLDVCLAVANNLTASFGGLVPEKLADMVNAGKLGRKTGQGFYQYKQGQPVKKKTATSNTDAKLPLAIANRLIFRMINEAAACLREGVVADSDLLDGAMIFGTGFAPFRGGPMQYVDTYGKAEIKAMFIQLESAYGQRFKPDVTL